MLVPGFDVESSDVLPVACSTCTNKCGKSGNLARILMLASLKV